MPVEKPFKKISNNFLTCSAAFFKFTTSGIKTLHTVSSIVMELQIPLMLLLLEVKLVRHISQSKQLGT